MTARLTVPVYLNVRKNHLLRNRKPTSKMAKQSAFYNQTGRKTSRVQHANPKPTTAVKVAQLNFSISPKSSLTTQKNLN